MTTTTTTRKFLFVGLACFDVVSVCDSYPEEDSDTRAVDQAFRRGGNSSNSCTCLTSLLKWHKRNGGEKGVDVQVEFFGTMAEDVGGHFMEKDMKDCGIITENVVKYNNALSPLASIIISQQTGSRTIVHNIKNLPELTCRQFQERIDVQHYAWIHFEARKNLPEIQGMIRFIRQKAKDKGNITISVEVEKPSELRDPIWKEDVDVFFVSKDYVRVKGASSLDDAIGVLSKLIPCDKELSTTIVCAWGETGASAAIIQSGSIEKDFSSPACPPIHVVDTTGAGDAFIAAIIFSIGILREDIKTALSFGCKFAGAKCGTFGNEGLDHFESFLK